MAQIITCTYVIKIEYDLLRLVLFVVLIPRCSHRRSCGRHLGNYHHCGSFGRYLTETEVVGTEPSNIHLMFDLIANKRLTYYIYMRYTYGEFILCVFCSHYPFPYRTVTSLFWKYLPFQSLLFSKCTPPPPSALFWRHPFSHLFSFL